MTIREWLEQHGAKDIDRSQVYDSELDLEIERAEIIGINYGLSFHVGDTEALVGFVLTKAAGRGRRGAIYIVRDDSQGRRWDALVRRHSEGKSYASYHNVPREAFAEANLPNYRPSPKVRLAHSA